MMAPVLHSTGYEQDEFREMITEMAVKGEMRFSSDCSWKRRAKGWWRQFPKGETTARSPGVLRFFSFAARKRQNKERKQWRETWD
jgi:hypothetical protein